MRIGIYTRLSEDRDGTKTGTDRQEMDCRAWADRQGWEVEEVYEDKNLSGFKRGVVREDYDRMLGDLESGRIGTVLVWKLDRLTRQPGQFERVVEVCERVGARIHSVHDPADMTTPSGLAMLRVGMAFANMESQGMSLRIRAAKMEAAKNGKPNGGGLRPFGFTKDKMGIVPDEAELIREAARRILAGEGTVRICKDWAERGVKTSRGNEFEPSHLKKMLVNYRLAGKRIHRGDVHESEHIPAILDLATVERLRGILMDPSRNTVREVRTRLLTGFLRCGRCGEPLRPKNRQGGAGIYRCEKRPGSDGCGKLVVVGGHVENEVVRQVLSVIDERALAQAMTDQANEGTSLLNTEIREDEDQLRQLARDYAERMFSRAEYMEMRSVINMRLEKNRRRLAQERGQDMLEALPVGQSLRDAWDGADVHWKRNLLRTVVDHITVAPSAGKTNRFDPERVTIHWK